MCGGIVHLRNEAGIAPGLRNSSDRASSWLTPHDTVSDEPVHGVTRACCGRSAVVVFVGRGAVVVRVARSGVDGDATKSITSGVAENIPPLAAERAERARRLACVAADRHVDLVPARVSRHRMRAGGGWGGQVRARRRSGVYNAQLRRAGI